MLTAIPVRWLEDNRGWLVETKLTASGSAAAAAALSGALAGEQHSRESLQWACAPNTAEALNQSGRRKQAQAHPVPPGRQLGGAVHLAGIEERLRRPAILAVVRGALRHQRVARVHSSSSRSSAIVRWL